MFLIVPCYIPHMCLQAVKAEKDPKLDLEDLQHLTVKIVVEKHHADEDVEVVHPKKN